MADASDDSETSRAIPSPGASADDRDGVPTSEEWRNLQAEWTHDYGLRRMEDRGVKYEDEAERKLDHAAERKAGDQPSRLWPSEIAEANRRKQPRQDQGRGSDIERANSHDGGYSM